MAEHLLPLLATTSLLRARFPNRKWKLILSTSVPEPVPEVSVSRNILKELMRVSVCLGILQENELPELLFSLAVPQSSGCLLWNLKVFGACNKKLWYFLCCRTVPSSQSCRLVQNHVAVAPFVWLNLGPQCWPTAQKSKQEETAVSHLLVRMLKPWNDFRTFLGIRFFSLSMDKCLDVFMDCIFWFRHPYCYR